MLLDAIAQTSESLAETRSRKKKVELLASCIAAMTPDEAAIGVPYLAGSLPQGRIGVGYAQLESARAAAPSPAPSLTLVEVDRRIAEIGAARGAGSGAKRLELVGALFARATAREQRLLRGLLLGELRQGALESVVLEGLSRATSTEPARLRRARMVEADLGLIARRACEQGAAGLADFDLRMFAPISPMLAQTAESPREAFGRLGPDSIAELKLDGARVQLHKAGDDIKVFTRSLNEVTAAVPELVDDARAWPVDEIIVDGEAIAMRGDGSPHPFQVTMRRFGRKLDVASQRAELPLEARYFDILRVDGQTLLDLPTRERIEAMRGNVSSDRIIERVPAMDAEAIGQFLLRATGQGHEGIMVKDLSAAYEAGNRGASWLKLKRTHTLDLVIIAVEDGSGRRRGFLSNLHLGARNPESACFEMVGKTFKGLTDAMLAFQTKRLSELAIGREGHVLHVRPELVVEVAFNDVQTSPHYPSGVALRFARVKGYRTDKLAEQADTIERVREIHRASLGPPCESSP